MSFTGTLWLWVRFPSMDLTQKIFLSLVYPGQGRAKHRKRGNSAHSSDEKNTHRTQSLAEEVGII